jgi:glycosyltransferase involved in cell wall biosynthesis
VAARGADLVHVHGEVASLLSLPLLRARPSVVTLHGLHLLRRASALFPRGLARLGVGAIVAAADRTICVSHTEFEDLSWLEARLPGRLAVVRNGIRVPEPPAIGRRADLRQALGLEEDHVAVLYAGQLEPRKDLLTLARAAERAHRADARIRLLIAGAGPEAAVLSEWQSPEIRLLGERGDVGDLLLACDVFVMPSLREGLSYAVLEALAHGVPTVVSDGPGNPEAVGAAGSVFPAGDDERLAALLLELAAEPARRKALGDAGRARVTDELSLDGMLRGTAAIYEAVLRGPAPAPSAAFA